MIVFHGSLCMGSTSVLISKCCERRRCANGGRSGRLRLIKAQYRGFVTGRCSHAVIRSHICTGMRRCEQRKRKPLFPTRNFFEEGYYSLQRTSKAYSEIIREVLKTRRQLSHLVWKARLRFQSFFARRAHRYLYLPKCSSVKFTTRTLWGEKYGRWAIRANMLIS